MDNVKKAEEVMKKLSNDDNLVTTTQIRRFLTAVNQVSGKVEKWKQDKKVGSHEALPEELQAQIKYLKVKIAYTIGREKASSKKSNNRSNQKRSFTSVSDGREKASNKKSNNLGKAELFFTESDLLGIIDSIGSDIKKYENFASYVEALVAFHKYYGGRD